RQSWGKGKTVKASKTLQIRAFLRLGTRGTGLALRQSIIRGTRAGRCSSPRVTGEPRRYAKEFSMRRILLALAALAAISFSAVPALADGRHGRHHHRHHGHHHHHHGHHHRHHHHGHHHHYRPHYHGHYWHHYHYHPQVRPYYGVYPSRPSFGLHLVF